ncbi:hypothetical protein RRG08_054432 [Elysia crispata]|uniref:Uncharacterized protein n=1 Tax=Elysia crispata TaxID=231223 RepID=A0AAE1AVS3_9GAST|nr:hypothetical protein RRG08_054432 [Elysia crispata]
MWENPQLGTSQYRSKVGLVPRCDRKLVQDLIMSWGSPGRCGEDAGFVQGENVTILHPVMGVHKTGEDRG